MFVTFKLALKAMPKTLILAGMLSVSSQTAQAASQPLEITDLAGKRHSLASKTNRATVLVFVAHDCPISNAYAPEVSRIAADYAKRGVKLFVVYADAQFSAARARQHASQFGYRVPLVLDPKHQLSSALGATVTPEAILLSPAGKFLYRGRINNRYATWGKVRSRITENDLREALDETLAGKPVSQPMARAVGCFIPVASK